MASFQREHLSLRLTFSDSNRTSIETASLSPQRGTGARKRRRGADAIRRPSRASLQIGAAPAGDFAPTQRGSGVSHRPSGGQESLPGSGCRPVGRPAHLPEPHDFQSRDGRLWLHKSAGRALEERRVSSFRGSAHAPRFLPGCSLTPRAPEAPPGFLRPLP